EIIPQVQPNPGMPERKAVGRHRQRVLELLPSLPANAQLAIRESMAQEDEVLATKRAHEQGQGGAAEWTAAPGAVAVADAPTDVYDFGGNDAPTQQWEAPAEGTTEQIDTTKKPRHGDGRS
ncbi:ABC transporter ATP-binding protein, partial [Gordonia sp. NPDC003376]